MKKKKKRVSAGDIGVSLVFFIGLSLLLYPSISNFWNSMHQTKAIQSYSEAVSQIDEEEYERIWQSAVDYNKNLVNRSNMFQLSEEQQQEYKENLNISGNGIMGYIEIPSIDVELPVYHGTSDRVLQMAVGHLEWSSLPVGGESSHCVLSGHRGLPSAKLFTDLDKLSEGDVFMLRVMDEILTYEVDQILIVSPKDTQALQLEKGKDYCTLITCTPYGINTDRLLVRGHRIENIEEADYMRVTAEAVQIEPLIVALVISIPILILFLICLGITDKRKSRGE